MAKIRDTIKPNFDSSQFFTAPPPPDPREDFIRAAKRAGDQWTQAKIAHATKNLPTILANRDGVYVITDVTN